VPTGEDHQRRRDALANYVDPDQKLNPIVGDGKYLNQNLPPRRPR